MSEERVFDDEDMSYSEFISMISAYGFTENTIHYYNSLMLDIVRKIYGYWEKKQLKSIQEMQMQMNKY